MSNTYELAARLYDLDYRDKSDVPFFIERAQGGSVLELACGTGRVSLPLAESGARVHGLDLSPQMLCVFREKLSQAVPEVQERVTITQGNMAAFALGETFSLVIIPFRSFQALTEEDDIANCLRCVKAHLAPGGRFIVNCFVPRMGMRKWGYPETVSWEREGVVCKSYGERVDPNRQIIYPVMVYETGGERIEEPLTLRYWYPRQLRKRLRQAGFRIVERHGDFEGEAIKRHGGEQIYVCEVAA